MNIKIIIYICTVMRKLTISQQEKLSKDNYYLFSKNKFKRCEDN